MKVSISENPAGAFLDAPVGTYIALGIFLQSSKAAWTLDPILWRGGYLFLWLEKRGSQGLPSLLILTLGALPVF